MDEVSRCCSLSDVGTAATLAAAFAATRTLPESLQERGARRAAALHVFLRGSRASELEKTEAARILAVDFRRLEREFLAGVYLELLYTLREHRPSGWNPTIALEGREHLDAALDAGRGAVLWSFPCTFGGLVGKKALHAEGYSVAMFASRIHPYSGTRFGMSRLNPVRTRVEDRYIVERIVTDADSAAIALRRSVELLKDNTLVEIAAIGAADAPAKIPFLGGTLNLALGAPTAAMLAGSVLIPSFPVPDGAGGFRVGIEAPLTDTVDGGPKARATALAREYATILRRYVEQVPQVWRGWFNRMNWTPGR